jgi:hypothetical protein
MVQNQRQFFKLSLSLKRIFVVLDLQPAYLKPYLDELRALDTTIQQVVIITDILKIYNREIRDKQEI